MGGGEREREREGEREREREREVLMQKMKCHKPCIESQFITQSVKLLQTRSECILGLKGIVRM